MHLEEFAEGTSIWHRLDPRVKIPALLSFAAVTAVSGDLLALCLSFAASAALLLTAGLQWRKVASRLAVVNAFVVFLWLFLPFTVEGEALSSFGSLKIYREGLLLCVFITMKANGIAAATIALLGTSSIFQIGHALAHFRVPASLVQMFFFSYRYLSVIHEEYTRLRTSMKIRCFRPGMNLHVYRSLANMVGMLFVRSHDRSERIYQAMLLRGFDGVFWTLDHFHMHRSDWIAAVLMAFFIISLVGIQIPWRGL